MHQYFNFEEKATVIAERAIGESTSGGEKAETSTKGGSQWRLVAEKGR